MNICNTVNINKNNTDVIVAIIVIFIYDFRKFIPVYSLKEMQQNSLTTCSECLTSTPTEPSTSKSLYVTSGKHCNQGGLY